MENTSDIHLKLAHSLRDARKARGLSLDAVARLSGVSRSMVSQIERGTSSPTIATLWNLTRALQVDFAGLLDAPDVKVIEVTRAGAVPVITRSPGVRIRILSPADAAGTHEVYDMEFDAGATLASNPHSPGAREHITVIAGQIEVRSGSDSEILGAGDNARYAVDQPHAISARTDARVVLIVQQRASSRMREI